MATARLIEDLGDPDDKVRLAPGVDIMAATLSPEEGFVLSRLDGEIGLRTLCLATGIGVGETVAVLERLRARGIVVIGDGRPPARVAPQDAGTSEAAADAFRVIPGPEDDEEPPEDADLDIPAETRKRIRAFHRRLGDLDFFQILEVSPDADAKTIRRAYFKRSKEFHPDRFYNVNAGRYRDLCAAIFKQVTAAFEVLEDPQKRAAYRASIAGEREREDLARRLAEQLAELSAELGEDIAERAAGMAAAEEGAAVPPPPPRARPARAKRDSAVHRLARAEEFATQGANEAEEGRWLAAAASFRLAVSLCPDEPGYRARYDEALARSRKETGDALAARAALEAEAGRHEASARLYARAGELTGAAAHHANAARQALAHGATDAAQAHARRAVEADPVSAGAHAALAEVLLDARDTESARVAVRRALDLDPGHEEATRVAKAIEDLSND